MGISAEEFKGFIAKEIDSVANDVISEIRRKIVSRNFIVLSEISIGLYLSRQTIEPVIRKKIDENFNPLYNISWAEISNSYISIQLV